MRKSILLFKLIVGEGIGGLGKRSDTGERSGDSLVGDGRLEFVEDDGQFVEIILEDTVGDDRGGLEGERGLAGTASREMDLVS